MRCLLSTVENSSDCVLYSLDETGLRTESDIRRSWSQIGVSPILESKQLSRGNQYNRCNRNLQEL
ncbi:hypothetical protein [Clostridium beijerinckii]|uniref:hypothetical protein n=1 Tax=Clostridium beijerinckii TaxID=1520 RepID=UPI00156DDFFF|nr:hypothetical protein [Clostridium beijerinckii]NRX46120.1 hypothetical protein [Clostridium beijerinckii]